MIMTKNRNDRLVFKGLHIMAFTKSESYKEFMIFFLGSWNGRSNPPSPLLP